MSRPTAAELLNTPGAVVTSTHLRDLGWTRTNIDAIWRASRGNISRPLVSWKASHQRREVTMIRLVTIPVAVAALAVTAAPAPAGLLSSPLGVSASANGYVANHTEGTVSVTGKTLSGKAKIIDGRKEILVTITK